MNQEVNDWRIKMKITYMAIALLLGDVLDCEDKAKEYGEKLIKEEYERYVKENKKRT